MWPLEPLRIAGEWQKIIFSPRRHKWGYTDAGCVRVALKNSTTILASYVITSHIGTYLNTWEGAQYPVRIAPAPSPQNHGLIIIKLEDKGKY